MLFGTSPVVAVIGSERPDVYEFNRPSSPICSTYSRTSPIAGSVRSYGRAQQCYGLKTNSHERPSARQSRCIAPFDCSTTRAIMVLPKPSRTGCFTIGPPLSVQRSMRCSSAACDQVIATLPVGTDSAPYLVALVANSCRVMPIA
jgi:hypothetical protein